MKKIIGVTILAAKRGLILYVLGIILLTIVILGYISCGSSGTSSHTLTAPTLADIVTALKANTTYGMVPGLALSSITLPVCTDSGGSAATNVTYTISGASWLSLNSSTRVLSLTSGTTIPTDANTATTVAYTCTDASDPTVTASRSFTVNDADGGGVIDAKEYTYGEIPLLENNGYFWLNPGNVDLYRVGTTSFKIPTAIAKVTAGMDATNATDDTADFDGDDGVTGGGTNAAEITAGTNPMAYATSAAFSVSQTLTAGDEARYLAAADFDNDGDLDLAVTNRVSNTVSIFLNTGAASAPFPTTANSTLDADDDPLGITIADFNEDGYVDLAIADNVSPIGPVSIFIGVGNGTFTDGTNLTAKDMPFAITSADLNEDGHVDLAVTNVVSNNLTILFGAGNGTFTDSGENPSTQGGPASIIAADIDGDGYLDLAVGCNAPSATTITLLKNDGDGTFSAWPSTVPPTVANPSGVASADLDGDGDIDLVVANSGLTAGTSKLSVFLNDGSGTFTDSGENPVTGTGPNRVAAADINGDGKIDLAVTNQGDSGTTISRFLGEGDGTFGTATTITVENIPEGIIAADFNKDGAIDLANANSGSDTVSILLNQ